MNTSNSENAVKREQMKTKGKKKDINLFFLFTDLHALLYIYYALNFEGQETESTSRLSFRGLSGNHP